MVWSPVILRHGDRARERERMSLAGGGVGSGGDAQLVAGAGGPDGEEAPNGDRDSVDDVIERLLSVRGALCVTMVVACMCW